MADQKWSGWEDEDTYWRTNYRTRPYASAESYDYDYYRPGYRVPASKPRTVTRGARGMRSSTTCTVAGIRTEHRGTSTWDQVKAAVRDAWDRVTSKLPTVTK